MRVIYVTSEVTYVRDNYLTLVQEICDPGKIPRGVEIVALVMIRIPPLLLVKNIFGLIALGAPGVGLTLLRNTLKGNFSDPRKSIAQKNGIPFFRCDSVNDPESLEYFKSLKPDLIVNMRTRNIYRKEILALPKIGCMNIHHGLLPENRGTMCDLWAWVENRPVGFSIHWMNEKIDDGEIICRKEIDAGKFSNYLDIPFHSSIIESKCLLECLEKINSKGRYFVQSNKTDKVNFTKNPTYSVIQKIRKSGKKL